MAEIAIELLAGIGEVVGDVQLVLAGVKEGVVIVALREIALGRSRNQTLARLVADRAGLLRASGKLHDVAFDTGLMTGEFQAQLFIAFSVGNDPIFDLCAFMA